LLPAGQRGSRLEFRQTHTRALDGDACMSISWRLATRVMAGTLGECGWRLGSEGDHGERSCAWIWRNEDGSRGWVGACVWFFDLNVCMVGWAWPEGYVDSFNWIISVVHYRLALAAVHCTQQI
jgi:hypothetical protein